MPTVFVFGAGASLEIGYPLASNLGSGLLNFMLASDHPWIRSAGQFFTEEFGQVADIEEWITVVESRIELLAGSEVLEKRLERSHLAQAKAGLAMALPLWFRAIRTNAAPSYTALAERVVHAGDTVITFNYDDSLERELRRFEKWDVAQGYGFCLGSSTVASPVTVLKLHGSMNWLISFFGGLVKGPKAITDELSMGHHPVIHDVDLKFLGYEDFSGDVYKQGAAMPCLILPGRKKQFFYDTSLGREFEGFWDSLWSQAERALKNSDKVIVCGYSLLPVDERACQLLLNSPPKDTSIEIISGGQTERIANEFKAAGFGNVKAFGRGYFSEWVQDATR